MEPVQIETWWVTVNADGTRAPVQVARVPERTPHSTGVKLRTQDGDTIALLSERKVNPHQAEPGYRYHEFRYTR